MTWLITSDLHLSDKARDQYRFGLFKWLAKKQKKFNVTATFLLGDITDAKDKHSSALVNRIVDELTLLTPPIYILKGNHDFTSPENPFFRFLDCIDGLRFISEPTILKELGVAMIPHQPNQQELDRACGIILPKSPGIMLHATLEGAQAETGRRLSGLSAALIESLRPAGVWAGDVHKPQRLGCVTYVGAPYTVRFGDDFTPRVLLVKGGKEQNLYFDCPRKWVLTVRDADEILKNEDLLKGDQVKIHIELAREEAVEWQTYKQTVLGACREVGLEVYGVDLKIRTTKQRERIKGTGYKIKQAKEILTEYCKAENLPSEIQKAGAELLKEEKL